jgi:tRNA nucleotidyltransferase (CCA-adding enzyme)
MSGVAFAHKINAYLKDVRGERVDRIGVIAANPDQSKHLETATFRLHGHDIDVNNLRSEIYSNSSRIPTTVRRYDLRQADRFLIVFYQEVGTALQDASRRDFTINSMFYNINTDEIEDLTGMVRIVAKRATHNGC